MLLDTQKKFSTEEITQRISSMPKLASLRSINKALSQLLALENSFTLQIAEVIRRDPSLTSRLLKLVNSVFLGLNEKINDIEEAVIYLGLKQIRELALATPVIEDLDKLSDNTRNANWTLLWQHSIGTAIITREILSLTDVEYGDDTDYIAGLLHNVGKIVIPIAFPEVSDKVLEIKANTIDELCSQETAIIGWDHARIGAFYLKKHELSHEIIEAIEFQQKPGLAPSYSKISAAIQIANHLVRSIGITGIEEIKFSDRSRIYSLEGWKILFGENPDHNQMEMASLEHVLLNLPEIIQGMV